MCASARGSLVRRSNRIDVQEFAFDIWMATNSSRVVRCRNHAQYLSRFASKMDHGEPSSNGVRSRGARQGSFPTAPGKRYSPLRPGNAILTRIDVTRRSATCRQEMMSNDHSSTESGQLHNPVVATLVALRKIGFDVSSNSSRLNLAGIIDVMVTGNVLTFAASVPFLRGTHHHAAVVPVVFCEPLGSSAVEEPRHCSQVRT
jgi:hypothetical protein